MKWPTPGLDQSSLADRSAPLLLPFDLQLEGKLGGGPIQVTVLDAHTQVVAGTNYKLKVQASGGKEERKYYEAQVWGERTAAGAGDGCINSSGWSSMTGVLASGALDARCRGAMCATL